MDCKTADEYINLYIDDMLGKEESEELLSHTSSCRKCSKEFEYARRLKTSMSKMGEIEPPEGLAKSAIKKAKKHRIPAFAYISAGAAAVVVVGVLLSSNILGIGSSAAPAGSASFSSEKMMAAAAPSMAAATYAPAVYGDVDGDQSIMAASEAPAESAETNGVAKDSLRAQLSDKALEYDYTVPAEISSGFKKTLEEFFNETGIQADYITDDDDNDVIAFIIPEQKLQELIKLIKKAHIPHDTEPIADSYVRFIF